MSVLKDDIEILLKIKLETEGTPIKIHNASLIPLGGTNYLCCWSTTETCGLRYLHQMQVIKKVEGTILFSAETIPSVKGQFPHLTGLLREQREEWIYDNMARLIQMGDNIIVHDFKPWSSN